MVAEEADREEITSVDLREDIGLTGGCRNVWEVDLVRVGVGDGATIGQGYGGRRDGRALVDVGVIYIDAVSRIATHMTSHPRHTNPIHYTM